MEMNEAGFTARKSGMVVDDVGMKQAKAEDWRAGLR